MYVPKVLGQCLHPSSLISNKAGVERAHKGLFWTLGMIPKRKALAEKDAWL